MYLYAKRATHTREQRTTHTNNAPHKTQTRLNLLPSADCPPLVDTELTSVSSTVVEERARSSNENKHGTDCCAAVSVANLIAETAAAAAAACDVCGPRRRRTNVFPTTDVS
ncbi:unnamed protein product [Macrosiphum euphorbiae]|uniref:Uncharacterized protein n=1 Tax=Macrosiphum euphorbiae TaxID=13131 RepID=A0AAV0VLP1_9HEMI|nr:unnamed protein product [Macrosiphum euphorbiae]